MEEWYRDEAVVPRRKPAGTVMNGAATASLILGHRGAPILAPENTLRSYRLAAELGADGIEVDVQRCADHRLPLIHDDHVGRTTNGQGRVADLAWDVLRRLDAGQGEPIPLLEDVLAFASTVPGFFLNLELKMPGVGPATLATLARAGHAGPLAISSFDYPSLAETRRLDAGVELWLLAGEFELDLLERSRAIGATCVALEHTAVVPEVVDLVSNACLGLVAWTVNELADLRRVLALQPAPRAVISNYPERALAVRAEMAVSGGDGSRL